MHKSIPAVTITGNMVLLPLKDDEATNKNSTIGVLFDVDYDVIVK